MIAAIIAIIPVAALLLGGAAALGRRRRAAPDGGGPAPQRGRAPTPPTAPPKPGRARKPRRPTDPGRAGKAAARTREGRPDRPTPPTAPPKPGRARKPRRPTDPGRAGKAAAEALYTRAGALLAAGRGAELGTKGKPSEDVRGWQRAMGDLVADGMYGPATRARGKALTGKPFPVRRATLVDVPLVEATARPRVSKPATARRKPRVSKPATARRKPRVSKPATARRKPRVTERDELAPTQPAAEELEVVEKSERGPVEAAEALYTFARDALAAGLGSTLGVKGRPSVPVLEAQRAMGGLVADGMYGPSTRARGKALTGRTFPVRA